MAELSKRRFRRLCGGGILVGGGRKRGLQRMGVGVDCGQ